MQCTQKLPYKSYWRYCTTGVSPMLSASPSQVPLEDTQNATAATAATAAAEEARVGYINCWLYLKMILLVPSKWPLLELIGEINGGFLKW